MLEIRAYDAMGFVNHLLSVDSGVDNREELNNAILDNGKYSSNLSTWKLRDRLWIKDLELMKITSDGVIPWGKEVKDPFAAGAKKI